MIDAKNKLSPELIKQFYNTIIINVLINIENGLDTSSYAVDKDEFLDYLVNGDITIPEDSTIYCISENEKLVFTKSDLDYWRANTRRKNKILRCNDTKEEKIELKEITYYIGIGVYQEGKIYNISSFVGSKKEAIQFINEQIVKKEIDTFLKQKIMLSLSYKEGDAINLEDWYSLDELQDMGAITLQ